MIKWLDGDAIAPMNSAVDFSAVECLRSKPWRLLLSVALIVLGSCTAAEQALDAPQAHQDTEPDRLPDSSSEHGVELPFPTDELRTAAWLTAIAQVKAEGKLMRLDSERMSLHPRGSTLLFLRVADHDRMYSDEELGAVMNAEELELLTEGMWKGIQKHHPEWSWDSVANMVLEERADPPLAELLGSADHELLDAHPLKEGHWVSTFSSMGFNRDSSEAVVYVQTYCGWKCAQGHVLLLRRSGDSWAMVAKLLVWVT